MLWILYTLQRVLALRIRINKESLIPSRIFSFNYG